MTENAEPDFRWYYSRDGESYEGGFGTEQEAVDALDGYAGYIAECRTGKFAEMRNRKEIEADADDWEGMTG